MNVLCLSSSLIGDATLNSLNNAIEILKYNYNANVKTIDFKKYNIDFCDGRDFNDYSYDTKYIINEIKKSDAIIISTPVYQASIPGVLKNLFDLMPKDLLKNKPVGIICIAGTPKHYLVIENQLKPILNFMNADVVDKYIFIYSAMSIKYRYFNLCKSLYSKFKNIQEPK